MRSHWRCVCAAGAKGAAACLALVVSERLVELKVVIMGMTITKMAPRALP